MNANKVYEGVYPEIAFRYAYFIRTLWLTAFYAPLVPVVVPISILGLTTRYWIEKVSYGNYYSTPNMISSLVNHAAMNLLDWFPFILSVG